MTEVSEIKGGATEFEAAVVAIVVEHVQREERRRWERRGEPTTTVPAWVAAVRPEIARRSWSLWR